MIERKVTRRYIQALLDTAVAKGRIEETKQELHAVDRVLKADGDLMNFLLHPRISRQRKKELIEEIFSARVSTVVKRFLEHLVDKKREAMLAVVFEEYQKAADRLQGIVKAKICSASDLSPNQKQRLKDVLAKKVHKKVELEFTLAKEIIGGLQVFIGSEVLDGSIRGRLNRIQKHLLDTKIS